MALNFNKYATEANTFLKDYTQEMDLGDNQEKAGRILSAVLHGLREIISVEESLQLIAQLPMFLKAVYVNGWSITEKKAKIKNMENFIDLVRFFDGVSSDSDFESDDIAEDYINTTFIMLRRYVSDGELEDIRDELPKKLKDLVFTGLFF